MADGLTAAHEFLRNFADALRSGRVAGE